MCETVPFNELEIEKQIYVTSVHVDHRLYAVESCWGWDVLVNDPDMAVRKRLAEVASELDVLRELAKDKSYQVRLEVVQNTEFAAMWRFDKFESAPEFKHLLKDRDPDVRAAIVRRKIGDMKSYVLDNSDIVRKACAQRGHGLDVYLAPARFPDTPSISVANAANGYLRSYYNGDIEKWKSDASKVHACDLDPADLEFEGYWLSDLGLY